MHSSALRRVNLKADYQIWPYLIIQPELLIGTVSMETWEWVTPSYLVVAALVMDRGQRQLVLNALRELLVILHQL